MKKIVLTNLFVLLFLLPCLSVLSQERQVTGKVNDQSGEALPGVSVTVMGTTSGTVTDLEGNPINFGRATGRYFGKIISGMILYIGYILAGFTEKKQALHDIMAGCLVVRK